MQPIDGIKITIREATPDDFEQIHSICENDLGYICDSELVKMDYPNLTETESVYSSHFQMTGSPALYM